LPNQIVTIYQVIPAWATQQNRDKNIAFIINSAIFLVVKSQYLLPIPIEPLRLYFVRLLFQSFHKIRLMRMHSPIGANVQFCCNYYGMSPNDIPYVSKRLVWTVFWNSVIAPDLDKVNLIKKLLRVKSHKGHISLFCESEVDFIIWFLCTS